MGRTLPDLAASLLTELCSEVEVEPHLQLVTGEQFSLAFSNTEDGTHLDFSANGFWEGWCENTYIDVKHESLRLSTIPSHLNFFQPQVEWLMKPPFLQASGFLLF